MLADQDRGTIRELAERYHATRVLLFGSSTDPDRESRDIDLGVEGVPPHLFFRLYGELMLRLSKPVDLVDLSHPSKFAALVRAEGIPLDA